MPYFTRIKRRGPDVGLIEPTTSVMPTHVFYVAGEDADDDGDDGGSTTSCPLIV